MKIRSVATIVAVLAIGFSIPAYATVVVTTTSNANTLASNILGPGVTLSGSPTYTGAGVASGTFTGGLSAGIGIDAGIILTSGCASNAPGPYNSDGATCANGTAGDSDLNSLVPGFTTFDAAFLEFDFTTAGGDLFFNYVFASEEYNEFANTSFNDVFGFFLDGTNVALIPGTTTPVSINNVNGGNPFGTNAHHPEFYHNNDLQDGGPFFDIQYDGFTTVFTAQALGIGSGTHHIKLAIADSGDSILDSAVFIQAGTFAGTPTPTVPEPVTLLSFGMGLAGLGWIRRRMF